jgi:dethiobiotin synthetase
VTAAKRPGFTLLSVTAGSGKSLLTRSLAVLRRRAGHPVEVYKPVAVTLKPVETPSGVVDASIMLAALAAGGVDVTAVCDFVVADGQLRRMAGPALAPATLISEDGVDFGLLPDTVRAEVELACRRRVSGGASFLICEGAGGATDLVTAHDVSNTGLAVRAGRTVIFVASARQGGAAAALVGTQRLLPAPVRPLVAGFILNNVATGAGAGRIAAQVTSATDWPCLGVVPGIPLYRHLPPRGAADPVAASWSEELDIVADFVGRHLDHDLRHALAAPVSGPAAPVPVPVGEAGR